MTDSISVREATPNDIPACCALLNALFSQEADFAPNAKKQSHALALILENPALGRIYCADAHGSVIGMASILFTVSTAEGGLTAWLEDLVLQSDYRNQGIGRRLMNAAIKRARDAGCTRITLLADATNTGAIRFYERDGFVRSQMIPLRLFLKE